MRANVDVSAGADRGVVGEIVNFKELTLGLAWLMCVFYPLKGLPGAIFYYVFGIDNVSDIVIPIVAAGTLFFVGLTFLFFGARISRREAIFGFIGFLLMLLALFRRDPYYMKTIFLVFILPMILWPMIRVSKSFIKKLLFFLFGFIAIYGVGEHVLFHTHLYGLTDGILIDSEEILQYYSLTGFQKEPEEIRAGNLIDWRQFTPYGAGGRLRTGGFLGQHYQMGALFSLASIFFYVWWRQSRKHRLLFWVMCSAFALFNSVSSTAIIAFIISILCFELYFTRGASKIVLPIFIGGALFYAATNPTPLAYIYHRVMTYPKDSLQAFLPNKYGNMENYSATSLAMRMTIGQHGWLKEKNEFYSENDISNFVTAFGLILSFFIFRRFLRPLLRAKRFNDQEMIIFSMIVLNSIVCMAHNDTILTPNIYPLVTLLNLKCYSMMNETPIERDQEA